MSQPMGLALDHSSGDSGGINIPQGKGYPSFPRIRKRFTINPPRAGGVWIFLDFSRKIIYIYLSVSEGYSFPRNVSDWEILIVRKPLG